MDSGEVVLSSINKLSSGSNSQELLVFSSIMSQSKEVSSFSGTYFATELDVKSICAITGLGKSCVYNKLKALIQGGYLVRFFFYDGTNKKMVGIPIDSFSSPFYENSTHVEKAQNRMSNETCRGKYVKTHNTLDSNELRTPISTQKDPSVENGLQVLRSNTVLLTLVPVTLDTSIKDTRVLDTSILDTRVYTSIPEYIYNNPSNTREKKMQEDMFGDRPKKRDGYRSSDYIHQSELDHRASDVQKFVQKFLRDIYSRRNIDYHIPKSRMPKYYRRAKQILEELESLERVFNFIEWYLRRDSFGSSGWNLDLMVSTPVLNQYRAAHVSETRWGLSKGFLTEEDRKEQSGVGKMI